MNQIEFVCSDDLGTGLDRLGVGSGGSTTLQTRHKIRFHPLVPITVHLNCLIGRN